MSYDYLLFSYSVYVLASQLYSQDYLVRLISHVLAAPRDGAPAMGGVTAFSSK